MKEIFKSMIYMARRFKLATAFNILGLVLAYATFYLIMTQLVFQATYNRGVNDYQRLYRMECSYLFPEFGFSDYMCRPFAEALDSLPQVESYSLVNSEEETFTFQRKSTTAASLNGKNDTISYPMTNGNNSVVSAIAGRALDGSIEWTDDDQNGYIIPESIALNYFGTTQCAGDSMSLLYLGDEYQVGIRGVFRDFPDNSGFRNCIYISMRDAEKHSLNFSQKCYVKLKAKPQDLDDFNRQLKRAILNKMNSDTVFTSMISAHDMPFIQEALQETQVRLTPLKNSYFDASTHTDDSNNRGFPVMFYFLLLGCLIVIIVGTINFLNCTLVESPMRIRSINTRLVLGAARSKIHHQLIVEAIITSVTACVLALGLCELLSQFSQDLLERFLTTTSISLTAHWKLALATIAMSAVIGFIAGWYPAKFATSFQPAIALKASFGLTPQGIRLRTALVFFQLLVSMFMIIYIGILVMQRQYIFNSDYGFDKDRILMVNLGPDMDSLSQATLCQELRKLPGVEGISFSNNKLASTDAQDMIRTDINGVPIKYRKLNTDADFLNIMGIDIIQGQGRNFLPSDSAVMIINETAHDSLPQLKVGMKVSIGFGDNNEDSATIIGVCKNFRYGTLRMTQDQPFGFIVKNNATLGYLNIRIAPDANREALQDQADQLIRHYRNIQQNESVIIPFDNQLYSTYRYELLYFRQTYTISFICIILTLIGLLCLTMFETEYRRKEIGIRKVSGATTREIVMMLNKHYVSLILVSFVIAVPIAYQLGKATLKIFADSAPIPWWIYPLALVLGGGITLGTVILQSWRTARENPVNSIKTE